MCYSLKDFSVGNTLILKTNSVWENLKAGSKVPMFLRF
jgi:hypothetical protein